MPYQQFDDSLEQFVQILKMTTQAIEVNIFSKETVLIYADVEAQQIIDFTDEQKKSIAGKLLDFKNEINQRKRNHEHKKSNISDKPTNEEDNDKLGYT